MPYHRIDASEAHVVSAGHQTLQAKRCLVCDVEILRKFVVIVTCCVSFPIAQKSTLDHMFVLEIAFWKCLEA